MIASFADTYLMNEFCAVQLHIENGTEKYYAIRVKRRKGALHIHSQEKFPDLETFVSESKKNVPLLLCITGSKIINKKVARQPNYLEGMLFNQNPEDFYIQEYDLGAQILISVVRRELVQGHLETLKDHQFQIVDITVGPYVMESLRDLASGTHETIHTAHYSYEFNGSGLTKGNSDITLLQSLALGEDVIENDTIIAFSALMTYFDKEAVSSNFDVMVHEYKEEATFRRMFNVYGVSCLVAFFVLLLTSYLVQDFYGQKSAEIQLDLSMKNQQLDDIRALKEDRDYKFNIISNSSLGTEYFLSFYISEIGKTVPKDVLLKEVGVFPLTNPVRKEESITIVPKLISIQGSTTSRSSINEWVSGLQEMKWTQKVELTTYSELKREYDFTISIQL
ncbi:MAG: PilN domain-containing protein [Flavobacteriaceae bacterium]|nr:PilN domain-containing protein [Flavobacteriaceae bacterium]